MNTSIFTSLQLLALPSYCKTKTFQFARIRALKGLLERIGNRTISRSSLPCYI
ncbi:hypothetical protein NBRC111894_4044 [Sporolactobacillus inulinus]|uniref:Uncharacterized protein n=1 Tax=Sporolactobacillus inulinus TaxID=2078 RepID=A0A4Y1ZHM4_9BACL|nr:hypothetical protein NBRC111894_4044 [Sporolactobacillus inulinus]